MSEPIYHLDLVVDRCEARFRLNGVPFGELIARGEQPEWFAPPLNPYLVGADNVIEVEVRPVMGEAGEALDLGEARVELAVVRVEKGEPVAPGEGNRVAVFEVAPELQQRIVDAREADEELAIPQLFAYRFDNPEGPSFAGELHGAATETDEAALRDYAIRLRDIVRARDVDALVTEMEPKVQAYAAAYDDDDGRIRESLRETLRDRIFPAGPVADFERDEVVIEPLAEGRMWELEKPDGRPLISTDPDEDGGTYQLPVIVGVRDGALRIVR